MRPSLWGALSLPLDLWPFSILSPTIISALPLSPRAELAKPGRGQESAAFNLFKCGTPRWLLHLFQQSSEAKARLPRGETEAVASHKARAGGSLWCPLFSGFFSSPNPTVLQLLPALGSGSGLGSGPDPGPRGWAWAQAQGQAQAQARAQART